MGIKLASLLLCSSLAWGTLGDKAPAIPAAYLTSHPRLGRPTNAQLNALYATGLGGAWGGFVATANAWSNASPGGMNQCYQLGEAYLADKLNGGTNFAGWLVKIEGVAADGAGQWSCMALLYDWVFPDLNNQGSFQTALEAAATHFEGAIASDSPYSDVTYIDDLNIGNVATPMWFAIDLYPDVPGDIGHLRAAMDWLSNIEMPVWKQQFSRQGIGTTGASDNDNGGLWQDSWGSYVNSPSVGMIANVIPNTLAWANASGRGTAFFTVDNPWIRNWAYYLPYMMRPDWTLARIGVDNYYIYKPEYNSPSQFFLGSMEAIAAIYNDPDLRAFYRCSNWGVVAGSPGSCATPNGFVPPALPWFAPDSSSNTATAVAVKGDAGRGNMALSRNFPAGMINMRTGWGEDDTSVWIQYGDDYWSHSMQRNGAYQVYKNGSLTIDSGAYNCGSTCEETMFYKRQGVAANTLEIIDQNDNYSNEWYCVGNNTGTINTSGCNTSNFGNDTAPAPNEGGMRRKGGDYANNCFTSAAATAKCNSGMNNYQSAPLDYAGWMRGREYFQGSTLLAYIVRPAYTYVAIDLSEEYGNDVSLGAHGSTQEAPFVANSSNRTKRAQKVVRQFFWIPRGQAAYLVTVDQAASANSAFVKKNLIHTINTPTLGTYSGGVNYTVTRADLVTMQSAVSPEWLQRWFNNLTECGSGGTGPCTGGSTTYQYKGKLYGFAPNIAGVTSLNQTNVGGSGNEFNTPNCTGSCTSTNYADCPSCTANEFGTNANISLSPVSPLYGPAEFGSWRIEQQPASASLEDIFVNVQLYTTNVDTNVVSTNPTTSLSGTSCFEGSNCNIGTSWQDNGNTCTYTITAPKRGIGPTVDITGGGCSTTVTSDGVLSHQAGVSVPDQVWTTINSAGGVYTPAPYTGVPGFDATGYVPSIDSAWIWGNYRNTTTEQNKDLLAYNFGTNYFSLLESGSNWADEHTCDGLHGWGTVFSDPVSGQIVGIPSNQGNGQMLSLQTCWYDPVAQAGRPKSNGATPMDQQGNASASFDPVNRVLVAAYGESGIASAFSTYSLSSNSWTLQTSAPTNCPPLTSSSTYANALSYDSLNGKLYLYAAAQKTSMATTLYVYDAGNSGAGCTVLSPSGANPDTGITAPRTFHSFTYLAADNKFLLVGGQDSTSGYASGNLLSDTWIYDPVANAWTQITGANFGSICSGGCRTFGRGTYIPRWDAVAYFATTLIPTGKTIALFRLHPGVNAGALSAPTVTPSAGSLNVNGTTAQGDRPSISVNGSTVAVCHEETGTLATTSNNAAAFSNPYCTSFTSGTPTQLGGVYNSMNTDVAGSEGHDVAASYVGSVPWASWHEGASNTDAGDDQTAIRGFSAGSWSLGGPLLVSGGPPNFTGGPSAITNVGGVPYVAVLTSERTTRNIYLRVYQWVSGSTFTQVGSGTLNQLTNSQVTSVSLVSNGTQPCAAWSEQTQFNNSSPTTAQIGSVYAACWSGSAWVMQGSGAAANVNTSERATGVSAAWVSATSQLYVAFAERELNETTGGRSRLYLRTSSSGMWSTIGGGSLDRDITNGWAFRASCTTDNTNLFCAWDEQGNVQGASINFQYDLGLAQRPQVYVDEISTGGTVTKLGGSLNSDTALGSAAHPSIAMLSGNPVVAWRETKLGSLGQIYGAQWNGTDWTALGPVSSGGATTSITGATTITGGVSIK